MIITYVERIMIDKYTCIDTIKRFHALDSFIPENTSLYYFKINEYSYKTVAKDFIKSIEE